jgi:hypothetical protein
MLDGPRAIPADPSGFALAAIGRNLPRATLPASRNSDESTSLIIAWSAPLQRYCGAFRRVVVKKPIDATHAIGPARIVAMHSAADRAFRLGQNARQQAKRTGPETHPAPEGGNHG